MQRAGRLAPLVILLAFVALAFWQTLMLTPCCADDSYFAMIARELAATGHFGVPFSNTWFSNFDVENGGGPALILPLAILFHVFGVLRWLPGLTANLLFAGPLSAAILVLAKESGAVRTSMFLASSLALLTVLMHLNSWHFFAFLGEAPATAWIILGLTLLIYRERVGLAGLCFSLAFLTKQIALFAIAGSLAVWILGEWRERRATLLPYLALLTATGAIPVLAFELWKVATFGIDGYVEYLVRWMHAANRLAMTESGDRLQQVVSILRDRYFVDPLMIGLALLSILAAYRWSRFALMLWGGAIFHLAYSAALSTLWQRYFFIGVAFMAFAIPAPLLTAPRAILFPAIAFLIFFVPLRVAPLLRGQVPLYRSIDVRERRDVLRVLSEFSDDPIQSPVWQTGFDTLLFLPRDRPWSLDPDPASLDGRRVIVVINKHYIEPDHDFMVRIKACESKFNGEVFLVALCGP